MYNYLKVLHDNLCEAPSNIKSAFNLLITYFDASNYRGVIITDKLKENQTAGLVTIQEFGSTKEKVTSDLSSSKISGEVIFKSVAKIDTNKYRVQDQALELAKYAVKDDPNKEAKSQNERRNKELTFDDIIRKIKELSDVNSVYDQYRQLRNTLDLPSDVTTYVDTENELLVIGVPLGSVERVRAKINEQMTRKNLKGGVKVVRKDLAIENPQLINLS